MKLPLKNRSVAGIAVLAAMLVACTSKATTAQKPITTPVVTSSSPAPSVQPTAEPESPTLSSIPPPVSPSTSPTAPPSSPTPTASQSPTPSPTPTVSPTTKAPSPSDSPSPAGVVLQNGSKGPEVTSLEAWLYQSVRGAFYQACNYDQSFGPMALHALENWQKAVHQSVTGKIQVGSAQWELLKREATANRLPAGLSKDIVQRTLNSPTGYAIDGSQGPRLPNCVRALQSDPASPHGVKIFISTQAGYAGWAKGRDGKMHLYHTPDGVFALYYPDPLKDKAYSTEFFHAAMPWAIYFNGGVAFHYDGLFPSHGCVHIPSMALAKQIYYLPLKTPVVIHE